MRLDLLVTLLASSVLLVVLVGAPAQQRALLPGLLLTEVLCILGPAILFVRLRRLSFRHALRLYPVSARTLVLAAAAGVCTWGLAALIFWGTGGTLRYPAPGPALTTLVASLLIVAALTGLCEEVLFRGLLQGLAERGGRARGVVTVAVLFGAFHLDARVGLSAVLLGLVFGSLATRFGSVVPAVVAHAANNATSVVISHTHAGAPAAEILPVAATLALSFPVVMAVIWLRTKPLDRPHLGDPYAAVPTRTAARWHRLAVPAGAVALLVSVTAASAFDIRVVPTDSLAPLVTRGRAVVTVPLPPSRRGRIGPGHLVAVRSPNGLIYGIVLRATEQDLWLRSGEEVGRHPRAALVEVVVYPRFGRRDALAALGATGVEP